MSSGGEDPRDRGYPDLAKPETRVTNAARHMWAQALVGGPKKARTALALTHATRTLIGRKRR